MFRHALIQEAICSTILKRERRQLHARVAETIEQVCAERIVDFYGMLAFHHTQAESWEAAEDYLFRAGEEAVRSAASSEALRQPSWPAPTSKSAAGWGGAAGAEHLERAAALFSDLGLSGELARVRECQRARDAA